jgi:hypothetical protein
MDLKNYTTNNKPLHSDPCGSFSQIKEGIQRTPSRSFNRRLNTIYSKTKSNTRIHHEILNYQWKHNFQPQWFITILWNDLPSRFEVVSSHTKDFRNKFLTASTNQKLKRLSKSPHRPSFIAFQERKPVIHKGRQIHACHTHLHLGLMPPNQNHLWFVDYLIRNKVMPRMVKILKSTTIGNEGVVIKPWVYDHHAFYNLKDYSRCRNHQDPDLILDYEVSDLLFPTE